MWLILHEKAKYSLERVLILCYVLHPQMAHFPVLEKKIKITIVPHFKTSFM